MVVPSGDMLTVFNGWMQNNGQMPVKDKTFADRFGSHQETERNQVVGPKMIRIGKRESRVTRRSVTKSYRRLSEGGQESVFGPTLPRK